MPNMHMQSGQIPHRCILFGGVSGPVGVEQRFTPDSLLRKAGDHLGIDPWSWVLTGGEDHTLLATTTSDAPSGFRTIGRVHRTHAAAHVTMDGYPPTYTAGWESF